MLLPKRFHTRLSISAILVFIAGYILYWIGYSISNECDGYMGLSAPVAHYIMPMVSSLEMFVLQSDIQIISKDCQNSAYYMSIFVVIHIAAASITVLFALYYIKERCLSWIKWNWIRFRSWCILGKKEMPELHIFFSINTASKALADSIPKAEGHEKDLIILVDCNKQKSANGLLNIGTIFNLFSARKELLRMSQRTGAIIKRLYTPIFLISNCNVCDRLNLEWAIRRGGKCRYYFLSEEEDENIMSALKIINDNIYCQAGIDRSKSKVYCHASKGGANRAFEKQTRNGIEIELVDSAYLAVTTIKANNQFHPVNYITYDEKTALATSQFCSMIVGFGQTGQEALRFLYEFGQFIYKEDSDESDFSCIVVDKDLEQIRPLFDIRHPSISKHPDLISWCNYNCHQHAFWDIIKDIIDRLNYIVIATGNDESNMTLAMDIYEYAQQHRKGGTDRFGIFVRSYTAAKEPQMEAIQDYINHNVIHIFGKEEDLYQVQNIWRENVEKDAKEFYTKYAELESHYKGNTIYKSWDDRHKEAVESGDAEKYTDVMRKESQDMSNSYHCYTKTQLGRRIELNEVDISEFSKQLKADGILPKAYHNKSLMNLSRLEHKRWNAAHEMMGYETMTIEEFESQEPDKNGYKPTCNPSKKKHVCLVDWNTLSSLPLKYDVRVYDSLVVMTSLKYNR